MSIVTDQWISAVVGLCIPEGRLGVGAVPRERAKIIDGKAETRAAVL